MPDAVLIVEDDTVQQHILMTMLRRSLGLATYTAGDGKTALNLLESEDGKNVRMVILDLMLPVMSGIEILEILTQRYPEIPVIMITGSRDTGHATQAINMGALDFITKPFQAERLITTVKNALKMTILTKEVERLSQQNKNEFNFSKLIGYDGGLARYVTLGRKAAQTSIPVLITGETGVGKEVFAQAIHGESDRAGKPFITVNCGAIPNQLVESILFGHEKGAFTGATEKTIGKFREAEGGTIFLDEVGELPLDAQVKLLRVLQQQEVEPVGAGKAVPVNVRIVSATNRDLNEEVRAGRFREDLYFRLNVFEICLPPLKERREDIPFLIRHFIDRFAAREKVKPCSVTPEVDRMLSMHDWRGNVRDLENTISRAMVLDDDGVLDTNDFDRVFNKITASISATLNAPQGYSVFDSAGEMKSMDTIEREVIEIALKHYNENVTHAAKALGMAKSTFYRKLSKTDQQPMFRILSYILYSYALSRMFWWVRHVTLLTWVCIFIFLISTVFTYKFYDLKFNGVTVEGLIVGASDADPNNPPPGPKWAKFTDENGQDHYSEISIPVFYTTGAQIKVFHERNNPHTNYANTFFNAYGWFIFGLFILGFGGLIAFKQAQAENSYARPRTQNQYDRQDEEENKAPSGCVSVFFKVIAGFMLLQGILSTAHYQYLYWTGVKETAVVIPTQRPNLSTVHKSNEKVLYIADKDLILSGPDLKRTKLYKEVEILYDPDKPSRITMNDSDNAYGYLLIGIFLMIYAWAPTLVIALFYRIKRKFR